MLCASTIQGAPGAKARTRVLVAAAMAGGLGSALCQYLIFVYAPLEASMGVVQKIFYLHLPLAWWSLFSFLVVCVAGAFFLKTRRQGWDSLAAAAAEIGMVLNTLSLLSGSIWGRHSWGRWWTWDPRLTTALILWFLYAAYLMLRRLDLPRQRRSVICAVVGIAAFVDVPLVFLSARMWNSIHPAVFASKEGWLEPEMKIAVFAFIACFGLIWAALLGWRTLQLNLVERLDALACRRREKED